MKLISIFVCGAQKAGTTSLDSYLREHGGLSSPVEKEIHFFDDEIRDWANPDYSSLERWFNPDEGTRPRYDATPIYGFWPPSLERIRSYNPKAKLVFLFRDPFCRAWSHWCMEYARRDESLEFAEAIRIGRRRMDGLPECASERRIFSYVERGLYAEQLRRALLLFSREQMLFLRSEDLKADHVRTLRKISSFLDIQPFAAIEPKAENHRPNIHYPSLPSEADRAHIASLVSDDLREFSKLTGLDVSGWLQPCPDWTR